MGASTKEKGVLKLVHPGRHVEYHRSSITAAEIMRKNPRHSITRTDFFKNPYIVVRPESIMVPGQVFYIVPNKTVYKLVKHRRSQLSSHPNDSPNTSDHNQASQQTSPSKSMAGRTPISEYQFHDQEQEGSSSSCEDNTLDEDDDGDSLTFQARDYYLNRTGSAWGRSAKDGQQGSTNLKSCMKKEGHIRVSPNLRVTFDFSTIIQYY